LPARGQRRSQAARTIDAFSDGASARGSRCAVPINPRTSTIQQNLARALRATIIGVGWRRERSLRRARKQGYRSRLLAREIVADPHKVPAARQRRVLRGDRRSERSAPRSSSTYAGADGLRPPWSSPPGSPWVAVEQPWAPQLVPGSQQRRPAQRALWAAVPPDVQRAFAVAALRAWQRLPEAARARR